MDFDMPEQRSFKALIEALEYGNLDHETLREYARAAGFTVDVIMGATPQQLNAALLEYVKAHAPADLNKPVAFSHSHREHMHLYTLILAITALVFAFIAVYVSIQADNAVRSQSVSTEATVPMPAPSTTVAPTTTVPVTTSTSRGPTTTTIVAGATTTSVAGSVTCTPFNTEEGFPQELRNNVCVNAQTGQPVPTSTSTTRRP